MKCSLSIVLGIGTLGFASIVTWVIISVLSESVTQEVRSAPTYKAGDSASIRPATVRDSKGQKGQFSAPISTGTPVSLTSSNRPSVIPSSQASLLHNSSSLSQSAPASDSGVTQISISTPLSSPLTKASSAAKLPTVATELAQSFFPFYSPALAPGDHSHTTQLDPSAPGNSITAGNTQVAVDSISQMSGGTDLGLAIITISRTNPPQQQHRGYSQEEELFRAKWGWQAFDQAQRAASESAQ